ncbi:MAG: DUF2298 domain-containing protein [Lachnospiraceae bacterium]|jgi:uncharacterized membrane protein|nr:DUF2298 domain-containing protein [Lachnospiraceae bacterium]MCH4063408.1 DUF2298 domain-containing protein [Lachnospiraceae bacterium]MCH4104558.1 DUF2298 domain-containing protein [Lachnospiraceae bacterium]MCI1309160.1 DUF2298 domain-containing protein [Lachnospiraceae bacterium]MCI1333637.1 DUF2298 domain-containing protein [Lachnospiraceae bacterium]
MGIVLQWWLIFLLMGLGFLPLTTYVFRGFDDGGWMFAKTIGLFLVSWLVWTLNCTGLALFQQSTIVITLLVLAAVNYAALFIFRKMRTKRRGTSSSAFTERAVSVPTILIEEAVFLALFGLWVYIIGFKPEAYGTEKFMDYGFMTAMTRSLTMPFEDMWFAGSKVNYYYGGQYIATLLVKMTGVTTGEGYNLMRAIVASLSFSLPASLGYQLMRDKLEARCADHAGAFSHGRAGAASEKHTGHAASAGAESKKRAGQSGRADRRSKLPYLTGALAGAAVAYCGNGHYIIYGIIKPIIAKITGQSYSYWFPDSTRYIGYNPDVGDKTIHEFPAYSTVLGDLHAHYVNIIFVVTVIAIVYAWARKVKMPEANPFSAAAVRAGAVTAGRPAAHGGNYAGVRVSVTDGGSAAEKNQAARAGKHAEADMAAADGQAASAVNGTSEDSAADRSLLESGILAAKKHFGKGGKAQDGFHFTTEEVLQIISPEILLVGLMTGVFRWTNFWDFPIYYVTCGSIIFFVNLRTYRRNLPKFILIMVLEALVMLAVGAVCALPFTANFDMISSHVGFTHSHTAFYQLVVLWGLPFACCIAYIVGLVLDRRQERHHLDTPDLAVLMWSLCAMGLVFLPEVIYVKDIYGGDYYRANTMFKLTYQAFILFGVCMAYIITRALAGASLRAHMSAMRGRVVRVISVAALICLILTGGYIFKACSSWFGNVLKPENRVSTDASVFVSESFSSDFEAISWLNTHVSGTPTILEAPGDSYSDYERVSVATGLPTVAGWYVHEWLWRSDTTELNQRLADIETIYTSTDADTVKSLIEKYNITYIYIGQLEREKYSSLNDTLLQSLGETVYSNGEDTYILKVQ